MKNGLNAILITGNVSRNKKYSNMCPGEPGCEGESDAGITYGGNDGGGSSGGSWWQALPGMTDALAPTIQELLTGHPPVHDKPNNWAGAIVVSVAIISIATVIGIIVYKIHKY